MTTFTMFAKIAVSLMIVWGMMNGFVRANRANSDLSDTTKAVCMLLTSAVVIPLTYVAIWA